MTNTGINHKYTATLTNGKVVTRTTKRVYTHLVQISVKWGVPGVVGWCGSELLAAKLATSAEKKLWRVVNQNGGIDLVKPVVTIIPVNNPREVK